jgi:phosphoglycolate phosphatase/putative hydrolase of the HAD superfamily
MRVHFLPDSPKALIFDIDNTLYSDEAYGRAQTDLQVERLAAERGESVELTEAALARARKEYADAHGGAATSLGNAFALLGIPIETSIAWRVELLKPEEYLKPDPRLIQCLKELSRRYYLSALTNNPVAVGRNTLDCLGVGHFFQELVGLDSTKQSKPAKAPFQEMLSRLSLAPGACVSVGDRFDVDLAVPLEMGMGAIQVDGVQDVYALPELLAPPAKGSAPDDPAPAPEAPGAEEKKRAPRGLRHAMRLLPFLAVALAAAAFGLKNGAQAYSIPLVNDAEGRLDAKIVFRCFLDAYPGVATEMKLDRKTGEWMIKVRDSWFAYANGRFLPPEKLSKWPEYRVYIDAIYPWKLIEPDLLPKKVLDGLRGLADRQDTAPPTEGSFAFALYDGSNERSVYAKQIPRKFLGWGLTVNAICDEALTDVEEEILAAAKASPEVRKFVEGIGSVGGYNWRYIRGQKELSRHSFGIAIDILPRNYQKTSTYWQWDMDKGIDWAVQPSSKRWNPPEDVVDIFERHGFIWGGKWLQYDTMHFEYHPELIRLRERVLPRILSFLK